MTKSKKVPRRVKAAKRTLKMLAKSTSQVLASTVHQQRTLLDQIEERNSNLRQKRRDETKKRNADTQLLPRNKRYKKSQSSLVLTDIDNLEFDKQAFFQRIDEPLTRVCGSCGELTNSSNAILKEYNPDTIFFDPLRNANGKVEIIAEGLVPTNSIDDIKRIWLCVRCNKAIRARKTPKFSRVSGFRISTVPCELAVLNRIEARLIGLGISFTTCINLYRDGQEFTRGNAINYWNEPGETVRELPRPVHSCGVVLLKTATDNTSSYFRVRPKLVRKALVWLISNNPLYKDIRISEDNLQALEEINIEHAVPSITVTEAEVHELQGTQQINETRSQHEKDCDSVTTTDQTCCASCSSPQHDRDLRTTNSDNNDRRDECANKQNRNDISASYSDDLLDNLTESFELEGNQNSNKSELEHIISVVGVQASEAQLPLGELRCSGDPINEYCTKHVMQFCFPTLFPDGCGGYNPIDDEDRCYEYGLSDYCAHLMKWHDRRFIIHGNFKFFCLNLIQRRQIDGLVKRVTATNNITEAINAAGCGRDHFSSSEHNDSCEKVELNAAIQVLDSLKPYFRVVRGSGLYWSNARDDLMSMIGNRVMPTRWPTFFLTLSAADTIWPDFVRACTPSLTLDQCRKLSFTERRKYLNENPDISARHFNRRFQAFFDTILNGKSKPLGDIIDYFWRVEFQQRGSPHVHCLLWIKDAPDVLKLSETDEGRLELAAFIDRNISVLSKTLKELDSCMCSTCNAHRDDEIDILALRPPHVGCSEWKCDLSRLVQRVQQHICNGTSKCRKKSSECRFGFPKNLQDTTVVETSVSADGTPSLKMKLKREVSTINNYSPHLLSSWRANMDLQLIGNAYGAAEYAGAYISKAEPDTLRFRKVISKAIQRCDPIILY